MLEQKYKTRNSYIQCIQSKYNCFINFCTKWKQTVAFWSNNFSLKPQFFLEICLIIEKDTKRLSTNKVTKDEDDLFFCVCKNKERIFPVKDDLRYTKKRTLFYFPSSSFQFPVATNPISNIDGKLNLSRKITEFAIFYNSHDKL